MSTHKIQKDYHVKILMAIVTFNPEIAVSMLGLTIIVGGQV
jgi:hypothetical protein